MSKPRNHHFVPVFWQKRFSPNESTIVYLYDEITGAIAQASARKAMVEYDLNTVEPEGICDVGLETTELQTADEDGSKFLQRVLSGDLSHDTKIGLAKFFSIQILRVPKNRNLYHLQTWRLLEQLVEIFCFPSAKEFNEALKSRGLNTTGAEISDDEFMRIRTAAGSRSQLEAWFASLNSNVGRDNAEAPWTDLLKDKGVLKMIEEKLLTKEWFLVKAPTESFVLGDTGLVFDYQDLSRGFRAPLSSDCAIFAVPSCAPSQDIQTRPFKQSEADALNFEVSAWAEHWVAAANHDLLKDTASVRNSRLSK